MSGIVSGIDYGLLFSPTDASTNWTAPLLNAIYSGDNATPATTFASSGNPLTDLKLAQKTETAGVAQEAKQPQVSAAISGFKSAIANATTIQQALANPDVQQVLLTANGLANLIGQTGLVQKAFMSDPSDPNSLVHKLANGPLLTAVQTYDFAKNGLAELKNPKVVAALSNGYAEVMWRQGLDQATPGLSNALAFMSQASSIKSATDILDNETNFYVITGALGIPTNIVFQSQAAQESAINDRLNFSRLSDPAYVAQLTDQYLFSQQSNTQSSFTQSAGLLV